jgi:hypothetical protein
MVQRSLACHRKEKKKKKRKHWSSKTFNFLSFALLTEVIYFMFIWRWVASFKPKPIYRLRYSGSKLKGGENQNL